VIDLKSLEQKRKKIIMDKRCDNCCKIVLNGLSLCEVCLSNIKIRYANFKSPNSVDSFAEKDRRKTKHNCNKAVKGNLYTVNKYDKNWEKKMNSTYKQNSKGNIFN
jgi:hypothetical protein